MSGATVRWERKFTPWPWGSGMADKGVTIGILLDNENHEVHMFRADVRVDDNPQARATFFRNRVVSFNKLPERVRIGVDD